MTDEELSWNTDQEEFGWNTDEEECTIELVRWSLSTTSTLAPDWNYPFGP